MAADNVAANLLVHVGADTRDAEAGLNRVGDRVSGLGKSFRGAGIALGGAAFGLAGSLSGAVFAAANFEQAIADVNSVADLSVTELDSVKNLALQIGQATSFSATEGAAAIGELVKAGVPLQDVLDGAAMGAANLAAAAGIEIPEAATIMSNAMNMFGIAGSDAARVADVFAAAANASATDVGELGMALSQGGSAAAALGIPLEDTVAALALFSNYGIRGSDAGTSLKTMLTMLASPTEEAAALMQNLGIQAFDASGNFVGMEALAGNLQTALSGLSAEQRMAALSTIFGADAQRVANILFQEGAAGVAAMTDATSQQGAAAEMAQKRMDTLKGAIETLKGSIETIMIAIGIGLLPVLRKGAEFLTGLANRFLSLNPRLQKFIGIAGAVTAGVLALGAGILLASSFLGPAIAGMTALLGPLLLIGAAAAALYLAWRTNFGGLQDVTRRVVDSVSEFFGQLVGYFRDVANGGQVLTESLKAFPEPLQGIISILGAVVDGVLDFARVISEGGSVSQAFAEFLDTFKTAPIIDAFKNLPADLLTLFGKIPWAEIGSALWAGLLLAVDYLADITGYILPKLGDLAVALGGWILAEGEKVDWLQLINTVGDMSLDIVGKMGNLAVALGSWILAEGAKIDWMQLINTVGDMSLDIVGKMGDLATAVNTWLTETAGKINWGNLISSGVDITGNIVSSLGDLALSLDTWFRTSVDSVDWANFGFLVGEKVGDLTTTLYEKGRELIGSMLSYIEENPDVIAKAVLGLILAVPLLIGYIGTVLGPKAIEFIGGFIEGATGMEKGELGTWFKELPNRLLVAIGNLALTLYGKGLELLTGLKNGVETRWQSVKTWFADLATKIVTAVGDVTETLKQKGTDFLAGMQSGLTAKWLSLKAWVTSLPNKILDAIPDVTTLLFQVGWDMIDGFWDGIVSMWDWVEDEILGLYNRLPAVVRKVLESASPSKVFFEIGEDITLGLAYGILDQEQAAVNAVRRVATAISSMTIPGPSLAALGPLDGPTMWQVDGMLNRATLSATSGTALENAGRTQVVQNIQIDARFDDVEDMVRAARFVAELNETRTLYTTGG